MKKLALLAAFLFSLAVSAFAGPYGTWTSYKTLTLNTSGISMAGNVSAFPLLVRLDNSSTTNGSDILSGSLTSGGLDVVFTDSTGNTTLAFERERFSFSNAEFWVRVPVVNASATNGGVTKIRVYWGKSSASDLSSGPAVFDKTTGTGNGFQAVYHMNNVGTDSTEANSTGGNTALNIVSKNSGFTGIAPSITGAVGAGRSLNSFSVTPSTPSNFTTPNGMFMASSTTGWAVGNAGVIQKTTNGGATWTVQNGNTTNNLNSIACTSTLNCVAVGASNTIVATTDGGATWTAGSVTGSPKAGSSMYGVTFILASANVPSLTSGYIVGDSGQVFSITNFSTTPVYTLTTLGNGGTAVYRAIACENTVCFIGGDAGATRKIYNVNTTPAAAATATNAAYNIRGVAFTGTTRTFSAVGDSSGIQGIILRPAPSNDNTATNALNRYKAIEPFLSSTALPLLNSVSYGVPTANVGAGGANAFAAGWIVGNGGTVIRTLNSGIKWGALTSGTALNISALAVPMGTTSTYAAYSGLAGAASNTVLNMKGAFGQYFASSANLGSTTNSSTATDSSVLNFKETGPFAISAWVNPESFDGGVHNITTKGDKAYVLQLDGNNGTVVSRWNLAVYGTQGGTTNPTNSFTNWYSSAAGSATAVGLPIAATGWHLITGTKKPTSPALPASTELYVDGVLSNVTVPGTNTSTSSDRTYTQLLTIGKTLDGGNTGDNDRYWMGGVDEFRYSSTYQDSNYNKLSYQTQKAGANLLTQSAVAVPVPTIVTSPNDTTASLGAPLRIAVVAASAAPITSYTWFKGASQVTAGGNVSFSVKGDTLKIASFSVSDTGYYKAVVVNSGGSITSDSAHVVGAVAPGLSGYTTPVTYTVNTPITPNTPVLTGNPTACITVPVLPAGLTINANTCVISGTPTVSAASASYKVKASNIAGTDSSKSVTITVVAIAPTITSQPATRKQAIVGTTVKIGVSAFLGGDAGATYKWVRTLKTGVIDTMVTNTTLLATDSLTLTAGQVTAAADSSKYRVVITNSVGTVISNLDTLYIAPGVSYTTPVAYPANVVIAANNPTFSGGALTSCAVSPSLPTGLALNTTTCVISGTPTVGAFTADYNVTPTGPGGAGTPFPVTISVQNAPAGSVSYSPDTASYEQGVAITANVPNTGAYVAPATFAVTAGSLPAGLAIDANTGIISGTPSAAGTSNFTITVTNTAGTTTRALSFVVFGTESYTGSFADFKLNTTTAGAGLTSALTKFPVLIRLTNAHRAIFASDSANIRFANGSGAHLAYQIDSWNTSPTDTSAAIWVLADNVTASGTTSIRMYYNQSFGASRSNGSLVFGKDNGFRSVWHLGNTSTTALRTNSVGGAPAAKPNNLQASGKAGVIGLADTLSGGSGAALTGSFFRVADTTTADTAYFSDFTNGLTYSVWTSIRAADNPSVTKLNPSVRFFSGAAGTATSNPPADLAFGRSGSTSNLAFETRNAAGGTSFGTIVSSSSNALDTATGAWQLLTISLGSGATPAVRIFKNGALVGTGNETGAIPNTPRRRMFIGKTSWTDSCFKGLLDDAVLSNVTRSDAWIQMTYKNQKPGANPVANLAYGTPSATYTQGAPITANVATLLGVANRYDATPALPTGLVLDQVTGNITGAPTSPSSAANYTITAYGDSSWSTTAVVNLKVNAAAPTSVRYTSRTLSLLVGTAMTPDTAVVVGAADSFFVAPTLPAGISLNATTGLISGTPTAAIAAANYVITAKNTTGSVKDTVNIAVLLANAAPVISAQPRDTTVIGGVAGTFRVTATAPGTLSYQWKKNGTDIAGATSATYSTAASTLADTAAYSVVVTSTLNSAALSTTSSAGNLKVNIAPSITTQPTASQTIVVGGNATMTAAAAAGVGTSAGTLSYQWRKGTTNLTNGGTIGGATTASLTITGLTVADTGSYTVVITRTLNGTTTTATSNASVLVKPTAIMPDAFVIRVNGEDRPYAFQLPQGTSTERLTLSIVDAWGRTIWSKSVNPAKDKLTEVAWNGRSANGRVASAGMYVVRISVLNQGKTTNYTRRSVTLRPR